MIINRIIYQIYLILTILFLIAATGCSNRKKEVSSMKELKEILENIEPGTEILLADGYYRGEIYIDPEITANEMPIVIRAKNKGKAVIDSTMILKGNSITLTGFTIEKMGNIVIDGTGCRLSRCTFSDSKAKKWIRVIPGSMKAEIDHNRFENKTNNRTEDSGCQLIQVKVLNKNERHYIHHNHFADIPQGSGNGFETLQLITNDNPFDPPPGACNTLIENNLFVRCNGEAEIISVKSNGNILRGNTFRACKGSLVLRHGDSNTVVQNYFFGDGEPGSGGVRMQGTDQIVANNYFFGLEKFGLGMMDGTPDDLYIRVERAKILFNSFIDCNNTFEIGLNHSRHPNGTPPKDCTIAGNIFYSGKNQPFFTFVQGDQPENWSWINNLAFGEQRMIIKEGILVENPELELGNDKLALPTDNTPSVKIENVDDRWLDTDLFNQERGPEKTLGAIQYPIVKVSGMLTEEMVGPDAP